MGGAAKPCVRCGLVKELAEFGVMRRRGRVEAASRCKACKREVARAGRAVNSQHINALRRARKRGVSNQRVPMTREQSLAKKREWARLDYLRNPDKLKARARRAHREKPEHARQSNAKRKAAKRLAVVQWRNKFFIDEIYRHAITKSALLGIEHHVDHIVPLQHPLVCGLHVEHNLQVITARENVSKQNRYWPNMPDMGLGARRTSCGTMPRASE